MIIRLIHPRHGAMHVYDQQELERHLALGWMIEKKEEPKKKPGRPRKDK